MMENDCTDGAVKELRQEIRLLRQAVDELDESVTWQNNNAPDYPALAADRSALWATAHVALPKLLNGLQFSCQEQVAEAMLHSMRRSQKELF